MTDVLLLGDMIESFRDARLDVDAGRDILAWFVRLDADLSVFGSRSMVP